MRLILGLSRHRHRLHANPRARDIVPPPAASTIPAAAATTAHPPGALPVVVFVLLLPGEGIRAPLLLPALVLVVRLVLCRERDEVGGTRGREQRGEGRAGACAPFVHFAPKSVGLAWDIAYCALHTSRRRIRVG